MIEARNPAIVFARLIVWLVVLSGVTLLMLNLVNQRGLAFDFIDHYNGAQAALHGESPYSNAVTERNQIAWYGSAVSGGDPQRFNYPAYSILVFGVLTIFPPETAIVIWAVVQVALCLFMLDRAGRGIVAALAIFVLLREPLVSLLLVQTTLWSAAWIGLGLVALDRRYATRAGLCFALATLHPVLTVPLALIVLLRERRALLVFAITMIVWFGLSLVFFGWWIPAWIDNLLNYSSGVSYLVWVAKQAPPLIPVGFLLLIVALRRSAAWSRCSTGLSALVILLPLTGLYHLALFLPALERLGWRWLVAVGVALWLVAPLPFDVRRWEPLLLVVIVLGYEYRAELATAFRKVRGAIDRRIP